MGPICESSDKFLNKKNFPKIFEGDYLGITHVGAYGMTLSSNYNMRPTIAEIMVSGSTDKVIRKKQKPFYNLYCCLFALNIDIQYQT